MSNIIFELTPEQKVYKQMKQAIAFLDGKMQSSTATVMTQLMRLHQITCVVTLQLMMVQ